MARRKDRARPPRAEGKATAADPGGRRRMLVAGIVVVVVLAVVLAGIAWNRSGSGSGTDERPSSAAASGAAPVSPKIEFERVAAKLFATPGGYMDRTRSGILRRELESAGQDLKRRLTIGFALVTAELREARTREAVADVEEIFRLLGEHPEELLKEPRFHKLRALAYLRLSEVENCINRNNRECCIYPLAGGGVHSDKAPAEEAAASYVAYLAAAPQDLGARWLLNITHMAKGTWPDGVPEEYLIPRNGPGSRDDFPRFHDVARQAGFTNLNHAGAAMAEDFDGDGLLDIVTTSTSPDGPVRFHRNRGDGTFEDRTEGSGLAEQLGSLNGVAADFDDDGDADILVLRGAWMYEEGLIRKSLMRNDGRGVFTDVTHAAGLAERPYPTQTAAWLDFDNDGDLDVFVGHESRADRSQFPDQGGLGDYPSELLRNNGDGTFTDVAKAAGVTNDRYAKAVAAGDFDNDGWIDLYVSNIGANRLYRNGGDGTFTDVAERAGVTEPAQRSFGTWFFDFDNDGHLDIWVGGYDAQIDDVAAWHLGLPFDAPLPRLYRNRGDGTFENVTESAGLARPLQPMGANFGDLDNDGWLDFHLATGSPDYQALMPNVMLRNAGGRRFEDVTVAGGFGNLQKGHGVSFADLDNDGDQDVFCELGGFYQGDVFYNVLFENPGFANRFLAVDLVGTRSNRDGYGARVEIVIATPGGDRTIHRAVGSVSSFGGSPSRQEIGLGDATAIRSLEISWPASALRQRFTDVPLDAFVEATEGVDTLRPLALRRFSFAGGS